jgi:hypothetical protein
VTYVYPADEKDFFSFSFPDGFGRSDGAGGFIAVDTLVAAVLTWTGVTGGLMWTGTGAFVVCVRDVCCCC